MNSHRIVRLPALVFAALLALPAVACSNSKDSTSSESASVTSVDADYAKMVGRWQFVYDDARRASVEAELAQKFSDPAKLAAAKKEAEEEAASSTIELTSDHDYRSMIGDEVILAEHCKTLERGPSPGSLQCTPDSLIQRVIGGKPSMRLDGDELVMTDPKKGDLRFRRVNAAK